MKSSNRKASLSSRGRFMQGRSRRLFLESLEGRQMLALVAGTLTSLEPTGALISSRSYTGNIATTTTTDIDSITLDAGTTLSVSIAPTPNLRPTVSILNAANTVLASTTAAANGEKVFLPATAIPASGIYRVQIVGAAATVGTYTGELLLNATHEAENVGGPTNDTQGTAQDISNSFVTLANGSADRGAVVGSVPVSVANRIFRFDNTGSTIREFNPDTGAVIRSFVSPATADFSPDFGMATAPGGLLVGGISSNLIYELNPDTGATLRTIPNPGSINISGMAYLNNEIYVLTDSSTGIRVLNYTTGSLVRTITPSVTISEALTSDGTRIVASSGSTIYSINTTTGAATTLGTSSIFAEGLAVSGTELFAGTSGSIGVYDLSTLALKRTYSITDDLEGLAGDNFPTASPDTGDWYRFELVDGQPVSISAMGILGGTTPQLELYNAAGNLLASGVIKANLSNVIDEFKDTTTNSTADTYFVKLSNLTGKYDLVVTRDADFEVEPNNSLAAAQDARVALGSIVSTPGSTTVIKEFAGMNSNSTSCGCQPPDTHMAVGPNHVVEVVNTAVAMYNKDGTVARAPQEFTSFFSPSVVNGETFLFDPLVSYDASIGRWYMVILSAASSFSAESDVLFAVSNTSDPTGAWTEQKRIDFSSISPGVFVDYPKIGFNADAVVLSFNMFTSSFVNVNIASITKSQLTDANPATFTVNLTSRPSDNFTMSPATMYGSVAGDPMWFVEESGFGGTRSTVRVVKMVNPTSATPTYTNYDIAVPSYTGGNHPGAPQPGGTFTTNDGRMLSTELRNNRLVATHTIRRLADGEMSARWYEFNVSNPLAPTLTQSGDVDPGPGIHTYFPSIAISPNGDIGLNYMQSSSTEYVSMYVAGQRFGSTAGTLSGTALVKAGNKTYPGSRGGDYSGMGVDPIDGSFWAANEVSLTGPLWSTHIGRFLVSSIEDADYYTVAVNAGDPLVIETHTPYDAANLPANVVNPALDLYAPDGSLLVSDTNSAVDGRNARITHSATQTGMYRVRVRGESTTSGEYVMRVIGASGVDTPPLVIDTDPDDGSKINAFPTTITAHFDDPILVSSVQANDLLVNGIPALSVSVVDGDSFRFTIDPTANIGEGLYTVTMAAGAVTNYAGSGNNAYSGKFEIDSTGPRIMATTWNGGGFPGSRVVSNPLVFTASMSEALQLFGSARRGLTAPGVEDAPVQNTLTGVSSNATTVAYNSTTNTFTSNYNALVEGPYTLRLISAFNAFQDAVGNNLDGEPLGPGLDGTPSGDGTPGGNYSVNFFIDAPTRAAANFTRTTLLGSTSANSLNNTGVLHDATDTDDFIFFAEAGESIAGLLRSTTVGTTSKLSIELVGVSGVISATVAGGTLVLPANTIPADGTYTLRISGTGAAAYSFDILRNLMPEMENHGGATNDTLATAQDLSVGFVALGLGAQIASVTGQQTVVAGNDWYRFALNDGESFSLAIKRLTGTATPLVDIFDATQTLIVSSVSTVASDAFLQHFVDQTTNGIADDYYLRVSGVLGYQLAVTQSAEFDAEPNNTFAAAQSSKLAVGYVNTTTTPASVDEDSYRFWVNVGDSLVLETETPRDNASHTPINALNPALQLFLPDGSQVAADTNSAADGKNALLSFTALVAGEYRVRVQGEANTAGEYVVRMQGATGTAPAPTILDIDPDSGSVLSVIPTTITVHFSTPMNNTSVQASDLFVGGLAATAVTRVDALTFTFTLDPATFTVDGVYPVTMAAGAVFDLSATGNMAYAGSVALDRVAPKLLSTLWNGAALTPGNIISTGPLTIEANFSEALGAIGTEDITVRNTVTNTTHTATSIAFNSTTNRLSFSFPALPEGAYQLTLLSGNAAFEDLAGNDLDGEPLGGGNDGTTTGNNVAGGNYTLNFASDITTVAVGAFTRVSPLGSLLAQNVGTAGNLASVSDTDSFTLYLSAGETIAAVVKPSVTTAFMNVRLVGLGGLFVAATAGGNAALPPVTVPTSGTYSIEVGGDSGTNYSLEFVKNGASEQQVGDSADGNELNLNNTLLAAPTRRYAAVGDSATVLGGLRFDKRNDPTAFVDISTTGTALNLSDDGSAIINTTVGNSIFPAGSVVVSNNGGIVAGTTGTLGTGNTTLPTASFGRMLVPYWDDIAGSTGNVYWQQVVIGGINALVVQWHNRFLFSGGTTTGTFQLQVFASGPVFARYVYQDVDFGSTSSFGAGATIGMQTSSTSGIQYSFNTASVANGDVLDLLNPVGIRDIDEYTLDLSGKVGHSIDIALKGQSTSFATETLELLNPAGTVVATAVANPLGGANANNLDLGILQFTVPVDGVYTVRATFNTIGGRYGLVVTDDQPFEIESNNLSSQPTRTLMAGKGILGYSTVAGTPVTAFYSTRTAFNLAAPGLPIEDFEKAVIAGTGVATSSPINSSTATSVFPAGSILPGISIQENPIRGTTNAIWVPNAGWSGNASKMLGANFSTDSTDISFTPTVTAVGFDLFTTVATSVVYNLYNAAGAIIQTGTQTTLARTVSFMGFVSSTPIARINLSTTSTSEFVDNIAFGLAQAKDSDFYRVAFSAGDRAILSTTTLSTDPLSSPANTLNPLLKIYDPTGTNVLATDLNSRNGNDAQIFFTAPSTGVYFVEAAPESGLGEYYLDIVIPTVVISPTTGLSTTEAGGKTTFNVRLSHAPSAEVVIGLSSSNTAEGTVSIPSLTFTPANWNLPQTVEVTGVDDLIDDGDLLYSIFFSNAASTDPLYNGLALRSLNISNIDNDSAAILVLPTSGLTVDELGSSANFTVSLATQPRSNVTITLTSSDTTQASVFPASIVFNATNWNVPQTIKITGVDDSVDDDTRTITILTDPASSADLAYNALNAINVTVTALDNDTAGLTLTPTTLLQTSEIGDKATFTVALTSQPLSNVTMPLVSTSIAEGTVLPASLLFTSANWNLPQTITVTGVNDAVDDGDQSYFIRTPGIVSSDPKYAALPANLNLASLVNLDNDTAALLSTPLNGKFTTEAGDAVRFALTLGSQPLQNVTYFLTSTQTKEGTVSPTSITFTPSNWNVTQEIKVTGLDDFVDDGDVAYQWVATPGVTTDPRYSLLAPLATNLINIDNDAAGVVITPSSLTTTEAGGSATFTVSLASQPLSGVSFGFSIDDSSEGLLSATKLSFNEINWNVPQVITLTGVDDSVDDGNIAYMLVTAPAVSSDPNYSGRNFPDYQIVNLDDDTAGISVVLQGQSVTTEAGGKAVYQFSLTSKPLANVTFGLKISDTKEASLSSSSLQFTASNWNVPQTVTLTGLNDALDDGDVSYSLLIAPAVSTDLGYAGFNPADPTLTNLDDDTAGFFVSPLGGLTTTEAGGSASFSVKLTSQPTTNVTLDVLSSAIGEGVPNKLSLSFTATNWNTAQSVTVTGVNDLIDDGDLNYTISLAPSGLDPVYITLPPVQVGITNLDDDTAGIMLTPSSGLRTTEAGGTASFSIKLSSQPIGDVTLNLASSDATEGSVAPGVVVFTAANWNTSQTVVVTGINDTIDDGDISYSVLTAPLVSTDLNYHDIDLTDVSVMNLDDDSATILVSPLTGLQTTEAGGTAIFSVVLGSQPNDDVLVPLSNSNPAEGTVNVSLLTFTAANWNLPQTVTITGVDDFNDDGDVVYQVVTGLATSNDLTYADQNPLDVSVKNVDNDASGIVVTPTTGLITTEAGATATFSIALVSQPLADVTIPLTSSNLAEGKLSVASLTFTPVNWNIPQTVLVTGVDDAVVDGTKNYAIITGLTTSADPKYNGVNGADVSLQNTDDDVAGIQITPAGSSQTSEAGGTASFTVVLNSQPTATVTLGLTTNDTSELALAVSSLKFSTTNWNIPQTVVVRGVDDFIADGDITATIITAAITSSDPQYSGLNPADLSLTNLDNDTVGLIITPVAGLITTEAGGTATFSVALATQPTTTVSLDLTSSNTAEGTVSPSTISFSPSNWNLPKTITVKGSDDLLDDDDLAYTIITSPLLSSDAAYNGIDPPDVAVLNRDNDEVVDRSDAPAIYTRVVHKAVGPQFGALRDSDVSDLTSSTAQGDDTLNLDDEDGITTSPIFDNLPSTFTVTVSGLDANGATVKGWIDFNHDGDFTDVGEAVLNTFTPAAGTFTFTASSTPAQRAGFTGTTFARFRITAASESVSSNTAVALSGEVEDYPVIIGDRPEILVGLNGSLLEVKDNGDLNNDGDVSDPGEIWHDDKLLFSVVGDQLKVTSQVPGSRIFASNLPVSGNGASLIYIPLAAITTPLRIDTKGGNDVVMLDSTGGDFVLPGGLEVVTGDGLDTLDFIGAKTTNWNFTSAAAGNIEVQDFGSLAFSGIEIASGGAGNDRFVVSAVNAAGLVVRGETGADTVEAQADTDFTLSNTQLLFGVQTVGLQGVETANLTGGGANNRFAVNDWTGKGILNGGGGNDNVQKYRAANFILADGSLQTSDGMSLSLAAIERANLRDTGLANAASFDVSGWTGAATLEGSDGSDKLIAKRDFITAKLTNSTLQIDSNPNIILSQIDSAWITGGISDQSLILTDWNGTASFDGAGGNDTIAAIRDVDFVINDTLLTQGGNAVVLKSVEAFRLTGGNKANVFDVGGFSGNGSILGNGGLDKLIVAKTLPALTQADFTLTDSALNLRTRTSAGSFDNTIGLLSVEQAVLTGGTIDNSFTWNNWSGSGAINGAGGNDTVEVIRDSDFRIYPSLLYVGAQPLALDNVESLRLSSGVAQNSITYYDWPGALDLRLGSGSDSLTVAARNADYLVANTSVPARKSLVMKSGVSSKQIDFESLEVLNLNGDVGNNLFDLSRFTGNGIVNGGGGNDTLTINRGVDFTLGSATLQAGTSSFSLANIENIKLGDDLQATPVNNRFTVSRWQGGLDLQGLGGLDSMEITGDTDFSISNLSLKLGNLANTWSLGGIETAKLTGGISANRFSFSGWTGSGSILGGTGNDTFAFTADEDQVLTNGALVYGSGAGKTISLSGIESASLTGGQHNNFLNAAAVDLPVSLSGLGGDDVLWGGKNNDTLAGGTGKNVLVGGAGNDNLQGGSDRDLLIGGVGIDSLLGGDGDDILIGGTTSYDSNRVALDALLAAWITPTTYANRTSSMQDPSAVLPGTPKLNLTTVSDDSVTDALIGGNDRDWFFAELTQGQLGIENPVDTSDELIIDI